MFLVFWTKNFQGFNRRPFGVKKNDAQLEHCSSEPISGLFRQWKKLSKCVNFKSHLRFMKSHFKHSWALFNKGARLGGVFDLKWEIHCHFIEKYTFLSRIDLFWYHQVYVWISHCGTYSSEPKIPSSTNIYFFLFFLFFSRHLSSAVCMCVGG